MARFVAHCAHFAINGSFSTVSLSGSFSTAHFAISGSFSCIPVYIVATVLYRPFLDSFVKPFLVVESEVHHYWIVLFKPFLVESEVDIFGLSCLNHFW